MRNLAARKPDEQPRANPWLRYVEKGDAASLPKTAPVRSPTKQLTSPFDLARVEKVVGQLEARSLALVKYQYVELPRPTRPSSNSIIIISASVGLWLCSFTLAIAYVLTPPQAGNQDRFASKRVISTVGIPQEQKLASSVGRPAKALPSSSHKLKRIEATFANSESPDAESPNAETASVTAPMEARSPARTGVPQIQPCNLAVPHQAAGGTVDYWVMPHGPYDNSPTRVISVGKAPNGVVVRDLEDGSYYTVTPTAGWLGN